MATVNDVLLAAYAKSMKSQPGTIATESSELLGVVTRALRGLYAFSARFNPTWFGKELAQAHNGTTGWARPADAEMVYRIEGPTPAVTEVVVVPFDDKIAEPGLPAVYRFGQVYRPASAAAPNPQAGSLKFFYSRRAGVLAALGDTIDWDDFYLELPVLETAIYLAIKDGRAEELPGLTADRDRWAKLWAAFLEHETVNERRRFGHIARFNAPSIVPVWSLLAGGASAGELVSANG